MRSRFSPTGIGDGMRYNVLLYYMYSVIHLSIHPGYLSSNFMFFAKLLRLVLGGASVLQ